jgi:putative acetyltransferase
VIRIYQPGDGEELLDVWARASAVAHPFLSREFLDQERQSIRDVHLVNAETWVYEADGRLVGFVSLLGNEVGALFVEPAVHRSGIGRALIRHARTLRGALEVEVFERNLIGRAFYEKVGFEPLCRKLHHPTGLALLRLRLAGPPS